MLQTSRHRTRGVFSPGQPLREEIRFRTPTDLEWSQEGGTHGQVKKVGVVETMDDVVTENFKARRARGETFFNPLDQVRLSVEMKQNVGPTWKDLKPVNGHPNLFREGRLIGDWPVFFYTSGSMELPEHIPTQIPYGEREDAIKEATTACLAKRGQSQSGNLWESLAEAGQTAKMLKQGVKLCNQFLSRNWYKMRKLDPATAWLTYRYGVMPLIRDIETVLKGLQKQAGTPVRASSRGVINLSRAETLTEERGAGTSIVSRFTTNYSEHLTIRALSLDEYVPDVGNNIGLTTKGLLGVPWELMTYSFVADWFANVGDYIYASLPAPGYKHLGSCLVLHHVKIQETSLIDLQWKGPHLEYTSKGSGGFIITDSRRTRGPLDSSKVGVVVKSDFKFDNMIRSLDALALLKVRLGSMFMRR